MSFVEYVSFVSSSEEDSSVLTKRDDLFFRISFMVWRLRAISPRCAPGDRDLVCRFDDFRSSLSLRCVELLSACGEHDLDFLDFSVLLLLLRLLRSRLLLRRLLFSSDFFKALSPSLCDDDDFDLELFRCRSRGDFLLGDEGLRLGDEGGRFRYAG